MSFADKYIGKVLNETAQKEEAVKLFKEGLKELGYKYGHPRSARGRSAHEASPGSFADRSSSSGRWNTPSQDLKVFFHTYAGTVRSKRGEF